MRKIIIPIACIITLLIMSFTTNIDNKNFKLKDNNNFKSNNNNNIIGLKTQHFLGTSATAFPGNINHIDSTNDNSLEEKLIVVLNKYN